MDSCPRKVCWWANAAPLFTQQATHWDLAEEQQQQLWCYSGYLSSKGGRGGYGGASSTTTLSLQGLAAGRPDISEWWQVTWEKNKFVYCSVWQAAWRGFLEGFWCVGTCLLHVQKQRLARAHFWTHIDIPGGYILLSAHVPQSSVIGFFLGCFLATLESASTLKLQEVVVHL